MLQKRNRDLEAFVARHDAVILTYNVETCLSVNGDSGSVALENLSGHRCPCLEKRMHNERGPDAFAVARRIYVQPRELVRCERNKGDYLTFNFGDSECVVVKALVLGGFFEPQECGFQIGGCELIAPCGVMYLTDTLPVVGSVGTDMHVRPNVRAKLPA